MNEKNSNIKKTAGIAVFIAIIVILQMIGSFIRIGAFSVSLVLVPIVAGAAVYGQNTGALLGGAFGAVVLINTISGVDAGANMLWAANPPLTAALCLVKGILAGYAAGVAYLKIAQKEKYAGVLCAAVVCPVVNTGIFLLAMALFYRETLTLWAGGSDIIYYLFTGLAGGNFLLELCVNIILCPAVVRIIKAAGL